MNNTSPEPTSTGTNTPELPMDSTGTTTRTSAPDNDTSLPAANILLAAVGSLGCLLLLLGVRAYCDVLAVAYASQVPGPMQPVFGYVLVAELVLLILTVVTGKTVFSQMRETSFAEVGTKMGAFLRAYDGAKKADPDRHTRRVLANPAWWANLVVMAVDALGIVAITAEEPVAVSWGLAAGSVAVQLGLHVCRARLGRMTAYGLSRAAEERA